METFAKVQYRLLNSKQKENFNFHKVSAVLADYGFTSIRLSDDWEGADFIAMHIDGSFLKVQLKSRLTFNKKYIGKDLHIAFPHAGAWYLYPHDKLVGAVLKSGLMTGTKSWDEKGGYSFPSLGSKLRALLVDYCMAQ